MEKIIDLHIHSNLSDGFLSPKEIIDTAYNNGVSVISICDHDTTEAYTQELFDYADSKKIKIIKGVEISTKTKKAGVHVLGYNYDLNNEELKSKLFSLRNARHNYLFNVSNKLNKLGYIVNINELDKIDAVTKAHIANDVINNPLNKNLLIHTFSYIPNKGEFIETIMNEGCPAYVKKESISPKEAATLIRNANGLVILAHPVAYKYEDNLKDEEILELIKDINADGIESNYIYIDKFNNTINEIDKWNNFAKENNLITTIGSDFHNKDNIHPEIGLINKNINISQKEIDSIINNLID